jgi:DUF4097 and DUF4098 domain-containing protein YvlB
MTSFRAYEHAQNSKPSYRESRKNTLNFESCGGETSSPDEVENQPVAKMYHFPTRVAGNMVARSRTREEYLMTNKDNDANETTRNSKTHRHETPWQRRETFSCDTPVQISVVTRSGDVTLHAIEGATLEVTLSADSTKYEDLLETSQISFDTNNKLLVIRTQPGNADGSFRSLSKMSKKSWFDFGGSDLDVFVVAPASSSLTVKTISGDVSILGAVGEAAVSSISGNVSASDSCDVLDVKTTSGDVTTGEVRDHLKCRSVSGDVKCVSTATTTEINSASGDITLLANHPGDINVKSVSGDVKIRVARGLAVDINGNSVSGDLGTNIDLDSSGDAASDEEVIAIKITTISGDIRVNKAS